MHPPHGATRYGQPSLTPLTHRPDATMRLYCLPPAGLGPSFYARWAALLPSTVELYAIQLPGREALNDQPSLTDPRQLTTALANEIANTDDDGLFAIFGHSLGSLLAYETARRLVRTHQRRPALLALSAMPAPHARSLSSELSLHLSGQRSMDDAMSMIRQFLPARVIQNPTALTLACTPLLADVVLALHHAHQDEPPLDIPFAVYGGASDPLVTAEDLRAWSDLTTLPLTPRLFPGGHMYTTEQAPALTDRLHKDLLAVARYATAP
ncbi:thioesterase II family protein [Streptomyces sp. WZ.A104]|uniref:thioesterase II family protein n=1 Tax=Streptomyces sp. WZ.A104 TaxID=2023771 RepID=UPI0015C87A08|nr:alpha/beta fold hydrolase [Streptomyces sp. WZ.A104]